MGRDRGSETERERWEEGAERQTGTERNRDRDRMRGVCKPETRPPHPPWELASVAPANVSMDAGQAPHLHRLYRACTPAAVSPDTQALACRLLRPAASVAPPGGESTNPGSGPPAPLQELFTGVAPGFQTPCTHSGRRPEYPNHQFHSAWSRLTCSVNPQRRLNPAGRNMGSRPDVWCPQRKGAMRNSKLWVWGRQPQ